MIMYMFPCYSLNLSHPLLPHLCPQVCSLYQAGPFYSSKWKWKLLSRVWLFATPWTVQSMGFSRPEYWSGQPFPSPGDLPNPGIKPRSPTLQACSLPAEPPGKPSIAQMWQYFLASKRSLTWGFPGGSMVESLPAKEGDIGLIIG